MAEVRGLVVRWEDIFKPFWDMPPISSFSLSDGVGGRGLWNAAPPLFVPAQISIL